MVGTKNFSPSEFKCKCGCNTNLAQQELVNRLQRVRDKINQPIKINSAYRCPEHNKAVGGKENSAHVKGLAVDIECPKHSTYYRWLLINALLHTGFVRIGIGDNYIHADIDTTLPQEQIWVY